MTIDNDVSEKLKLYLGGLRRRVRRLIVERFGLIGLCIGFIAASIIVILSSRYDVLIDYRIWIATVFLGAVAGCVWGFLKKLDDIDIAISADIRNDLSERLSTAVHLLRKIELDDIDRSVIADTYNRISDVAPKNAFKYKYNKIHMFAVASLILFIAAILITQLSVFQSKSRRQDVAAMKSEGIKLVKVAGDIKKTPASGEKEIKKLADRMEKLGKKMASGRMDKKQAMLKLNRISDKAKQEQDKLASRDFGLKSMRQARSEMNKSGKEIMRQTANEIAKKEHIPSAEAMKKVASDKRMAELARKPGPLTESERIELEQAIKKYTNAKSDIAVPVELGEAITKLSENEDFRKAAEIMSDLAKKLNSDDTGEANREALKKQMDELAKALKDTDLDALAKQMRENAEKLATLSPEELNKLADEIKKSKQLAQSLGLAAGIGEKASSALSRGASGSNLGGNGMGGDDSNSGPKSDLTDVEHITYSPSQIGESGMIYSAGDTKGAPDVSSSTTVPYTEVYSEYKKAAEKSLSKDDIPPVHKERVKKYFDSLE